MTLIGTFTLAVRGNDLGHEGVVPLGTLARYGESARWEMFRDPTSALSGKLGSGVARAQRISSHEPLTYPATLRVETRLARVGTSSLDVLQSFLDATTGRAYASIRSTVVKLRDGRPAPLDPSLAALASNDPAEPALPFAEPAEGAFEYTIEPRASDMDRFRHVNQARYVDFAADVAFAAALAEHRAGLHTAPTRVEVDYRREVRAGTRVRARLGIVGGVRSVQLFEAEAGHETTRITFS